MLAQQFKHVANDTIEQLHAAMQSCPTSETEMTNPKELKTSLMPHQRRALAWALWRETQVPSGGILGDHFRRISWWIAFAQYCIVESLIGEKRFGDFTFTKFWQGNIWQWIDPAKMEWF